MAIQDMFDIFDEEPAPGEEAAHQARKKATAAAIYQNMIKQVKDQSFLGQVATAAKNEVGDLVRGTGDVVNTIAGVSKGVLGMDNQDNIDYGLQRDVREKQLDEGERAFDENANLGARVIGGALPYMVDSVMLGPKFVRGAAKGLDVLGAGVRTTARKGGEAGKTIIQSMAESGVSPIAGAGKYLQREVVEPVTKYANRFKNRIPEADPFMKGWAPRIIGDAALGAAEGGVHADNSVEQGAISSAIGSTVGQVVKPAFHRMPSFYNKTENNLIQWGKDKGMQFLPGMETGHRGMQMFENDLRGSSAWTDTINQIDRNNQYIGNRIAFEQLLPEADREAIKKLPGKSPLRVREMNPEALTEHMGKLSAEYEDFVRNSVVRLEKPEIESIRQGINPLSQSKVESNQNVFKVVSTHLDDLEKLRSSQLPMRDPLTGRMQKGPVANSGEEYQKLRSAIKNDLNQAHSAGNTLLVEKLTPLLKTLDTGLERGAEEMGGKARVAQWKDLNERWALSNLIMEEGMTPNGMVDFDKLGRHFMSAEPKRYLMETAGPRMKELYKATKLSDLVKNQASGGLFDEAGDFLHNPQKKSTAQRLVGTTPAAFVPGLRSGYMTAYKLGYPSQWGLLGLTGNGPFDIQKMSRSVQQSSQMYPSIFDAISSGAETLGNLPQKIQDRINNVTGKPKEIRGEHDDLFE